MKKILIVICLTLFCVPVSHCFVKVNAEETIKYLSDVGVNEYDLMVLRKQKDALSNKCKNINTIVSTEKNYEQLYLDRAKMEDEVLIKYYGYTQEQINILKKYDGSPIENNPQLAKASATLTASMSSGTCTNSMLTVYIIWRWSNAPLLSGPGITDRVAIRWAGSATSGSSINLSASTAEIIINYHYNGAYVYSQTVPSTIIDQYSKAETPVLMDNGRGTALVGKQTLVVQKIGSLPIKEASISFMYGHCQIGISPSFSYPVSFGISLTSGEKAYYFSKRVTNTGAILGI